MKQPGLNRRKFIQQGSLTTAGLLALNLPLWAKELVGPLAWNEQPVHNIPIDKNLDAQWIKSLYHRGLTTTYLKSKNELQYIGMPETWLE